jgi:uncharacterized membrane protein
MAINLRNPELDFLDLLMPWVFGIGIVGFLAAWVVMSILERAGLTRFIWHVPLFFLGLFVLLTSLLGFLFHP